MLTELQTAATSCSFALAMRSARHVCKLHGQSLARRSVDLRQVALAALTFGLLLSGCGDKQSKWSEEVRLQSGETIVIERTAQLRANHIAGGGGGSINEGMTVEIAQPTKPDNPSRWSAKFAPIVMDRDPASQEWFIVATFFHCDSWYALGRPKLPYTEYRFRNGQWVQQALSPQWIGRASNVLSSNRENAPHVTLIGKERVLAIPTISIRFKQVVDKWDTNC